MHRVLVTSTTFGLASNKPVEYLRDHQCEVIFGPRRPLRDEELARLIPGFHALIAGLDEVGPKSLNSADLLRVIARRGASLDLIDLRGATERGVVVFSLPRMDAESVADLTFGLILAVARHIPQADRRVRAGYWDRPIGRDVWGKALGIVGFGRIGSAVARRARGFSMRLLAYDRSPDPDLARELGVEFADLPMLLQEADFVTIHLPLTPATKGFISLRELKMMKPTAYLINTSRGGVVDEAALYQALTKGWIAGAALDVFSEEPPKGNPLLELENVVCTPHMGTYTVETLEMMDMYCAREVVRALHGEIPQGTANPEVFR
ncbi:MAG: phosphoglycerate dehydrogenase [Armatimonadota bacterium]|nr:phosphoglycerate dehydrogenase [Armatimonadota bacterium]